MTEPTEQQWTYKEKKFVEGITQGMTQEAAARHAGYAPSGAGRMGMLIMRRPHIRRALGLMLDQLGIDFGNVAKIVSDAMQAEKKIVYGRGDKMTVETIVDHATRLKAATMALRLLDYEADVVNSFKTPLPPTEDKPKKDAVKPDNKDERTVVTIDPSKIVEADEVDLLKLAFPEEVPS